MRRFFKFLAITGVVLSVMNFGVIGQASADIVFPSCTFDATDTGLFCDDEEALRKDFDEQSILSYGANLLVEVAVGSVILLFLSRFSKRTVFSIALVNAVSLPLLYLLLHYFPDTGAFIAGEIAVLQAEIIGIYFLCKNRLAIWQAILIGVLTNATTVGLSLLLWLR